MIARSICRELLAEAGILNGRIAYIVICYRSFLPSFLPLFAAPAALTDVQDRVPPIKIGAKASFFLVWGEMTGVFFSREAAWE